MCRLMRFWAPVFEEADWSVRAVLPIRSPLEVAWSLRRRDGHSVSWWCLLWLRHVLDAEAETRAMPRAVLDWTGFLSDRRGALARAAKQLELAWPNSCESALTDVDEFISPGMRHYRATEADLRADPAISNLMLETSSSMLELVDDPRNNVRPEEARRLARSLRRGVCDFWSSYAGVGRRPSQRTLLGCGADRSRGSTRSRARCCRRSACCRARRSDATPRRARCAIGGARCAVGGARCAVGGARCAVGGARCAVGGAKQVGARTFSREERG